MAAIEMTLVDGSQWQLEITSGSDVGSVLEQFKQGNAQGAWIEHNGWLQTREGPAVHRSAVIAVRVDPKA